MEWRLQVTLEWNRLRFETWNSIQREDLKSNSKLREKISVGNKKGGRGKKDPRTTQQNVATKPNTLNPSLLIVWGWVYSGSGSQRLPCSSYTLTMLHALQGVAYWYTDPYSPPGPASFRAL